MTGAQTVVLDCSSIRHSDLATVEHIARLRLGLKRGGCELALFAPDEELLAMLALAGLSGVLGVEVQRQAEQGEEPGGVQEEGEFPDPAA
jgi:anti-anti-sigma regulatory factor